MSITCYYISVDVVNKLLYIYIYIYMINCYMLLYTFLKLKT